VVWKDPDSREKKVGRVSHDPNGAYPIKLPDGQVIETLDQAGSTLMNLPDRLKTDIWGRTAADVLPLSRAGAKTPSPSQPISLPVRCNGGALTELRMRKITGH
jgi:hypothetical protein